MNDLGWIKYRPDLMFLDTVGMSASGERAHRRLIDYIWLHDGPPSKDNEILKAISQTIPQDWGRTKQELQGKGWVEVGEFFLHRRAIKSLNESKEAFLANHNRTCRANKLLPKRMSSPHPTTGVVSIVDADPEPDVTPCVTEDVTQNVTESMTPTRVRVWERELSKSDKESTDKALSLCRTGGIGGKLTDAKRDIASELERLLGVQWRNDAGKWINRIKTAPNKCERVSAEVANAAREGRIATSPAQYAEETWKRFA